MGAAPTRSPAASATVVNADVVNRPCLLMRVSVGLHAWRTDQPFGAITGPSGGVGPVVRTAKRFPTCKRERLGNVMAAGLGVVGSS
jgi:hypothetical protein